MISITMKEAALAVGMLAHSHSPVAANIEPEDLICMAQNVYFEARGEPEQGQIAVAFATLNRVQADAFPDAVCDVVYQRKQFSWTQRRDHTPHNWKAYKRAMSYALRVMTGSVKNPIGPATHYYAQKKVHPYWASAFTRVATISDHTFMEASNR